MDSYSLTLLKENSRILYFWAFVILINCGIIYYFVIRDKIFSPMTERKWKAIFKSLLYTTPWILFFFFSGWHRPWLQQESLSNLRIEEGILQITHYSKGNRAYLEGGDTRVIELVCHSSLSRLSGYENENVTIWRKKNRKYVYQMSVNGEIVFPLSEANRGLFVYNVNGTILDIFFLSGMLFFTFLYVSHEG